MSQITHRPAPGDHGPAKTGDKGNLKETCKAKRGLGSPVERAPAVPAKDVYRDLEEFIILRRAATLFGVRNSNWQTSADGKAYALQMNTAPPIIGHSLYIARHVSISYMDKSQRDTCGFISLILPYETSKAYSAPVSINTTKYPEILFKMR
ncbi:hypothetical protein K431DRAFT_296289 [Polychaeton citri CBS 116435]|uniref:Uncharacterized protein n=1 Tax=Polychaeton citri CBS 116435 TaxID=1314669 RepID=A0A9P4UM24_9PEZI|nr:hypothetical protein K431DRAFT_296289 [Polychaeton citri CBS 116435]